MNRRHFYWASTLLLALFTLVFNSCSNDLPDTPKRIEVIYRIDVKASNSTPFTIEGQYSDVPGSVSISGTYTPFEKTIRDVRPGTKLQFSGHLMHWTTKEIVGIIQMTVKDQDTGRIIKDLKKELNIVEYRTDGTPITRARVKAETTFAFEHQ